ncbi:hypothetical protein FNV43_RR25001 [Rhamnella rubrinervis]|uniref:Uncharacterized protein n=1 Tax=Rhamnella rubrinervis TaxID=2594499 RepID=A0A8K0DRM8_9ROSA|nr:hypothetical protein FNV43_RR25001 [Rhamnella rubrinervis]
MKRETMYLGNKLIMGRSKIGDYNRIKDKLQLRLDGWQSKLLSKAGKITLIKSVAQSIPVYSMSYSRFPKKVCSDMDDMVRRFWWNVKSRKQNYLASQNWTMIYKPKDLRGLGFRSFWDYNTALLAKLAWMIVRGEESLWIEILKAKYLRGGSYFNYQKKRGDSWIWRSILNVKDVIHKGNCFRVGNGEDIKLWSDPWIPGCVNKQPVRKEGSTYDISTVSKLLDHDTDWWNEALVKDIMEEESAKEVLKMEGMSFNRQDRIFWTGNSSGVFSVRDAYMVDKGFNNVHLRNELIFKGSIDIKKAIFYFENVVEEFSSSLETTKREVIGKGVCPPVPRMDPSLAELKAIVWATPIVRDLELGPVSWLSDSLVSVNIINSSVEPCAWGSYFDAMAARSSFRSNPWMLQWRKKIMRFSAYEFTLPTGLSFVEYPNINVLKKLKGTDLGTTWDQLDKFNKFSWGKLVVFPFSFQVWAYKAITSLASRYGSKADDKLLWKLILSASETPPLMLFKRKFVGKKMYDLLCNVEQEKEYYITKGITDVVPAVTNPLPMADDIKLSSFVSVYSLKRVDYAARLELHRVMRKVDAIGHELRCFKVASTLSDGKTEVSMMLWNLSTWSMNLARGMLLHKSVDKNTPQDETGVVEDEEDKQDNIEEK